MEFAPSLAFLLPSSNHLLWADISNRRLRSQTTGINGILFRILSYRVACFGDGQNFGMPENFHDVIRQPSLYERDEIARWYIDSYQSSVYSNVEFFTPNYLFFFKKIHGFPNAEPNVTVTTVIRPSRTTALFLASATVSS